MSHNLMLPKETVGQGIPEKSSDWTCIEKKVRGVPPLGGAPEPPGAPLAIKAVGEEGCVGVRLLSVDCTCALNNEAMNAKVSEVVDRAARMLKVTHSIPDPAGTTFLLVPTRLTMRAAVRGESVTPAYISIGPGAGRLS